MVWGAEFGHTPLGEDRNGRQANTGRDHHPFAFYLWMAGGGIQGGQVYGETDVIGWSVTRDPVPMDDFHAALLHLFGLVHLKLTHRNQGRDFRLTDVAGNVIQRWLAYSPIDVFLHSWATAKADMHPRCSQIVKKT